MALSVLAGSLLAASPALAGDGWLWGVHLAPGGDVAVYHFTSQTVSPNPEPISFTFGAATGGAALDVELGPRGDTLALIGFARVEAGPTTVLGDGPPHSGLDFSLASTLGARGLWGLHDGGAYLFADFGATARFYTGGRNDIGAPDNVFDFDPLFGATAGGGLGWRSSSGLDVRGRISAGALFNDEARVFPFGLEVQIGFGSGPGRG